MRNKTPPFPAYPEWSTAKFFGFLRSGLREKFNRWPPKYDLLKTKRKAFPILDENGEPVKFKSGKKVGEIRTTLQYQCNECKGWFKQKEIKVDHIIPVGSLKSYEDLQGFAERMFVPVEGLQLLCDPCHNIKTQEERNATNKR